MKSTIVAFLFLVAAQALSASEANFLCTVTAVDIYQPEKISEREKIGINQFVGNEFVFSSESGDFTGIDLFRGQTMQAPEIKSFSDETYLRIEWRRQSWRDKVVLQLLDFGKDDVLPFRIEIGFEFGYSGKCIGTPNQQINQGLSTTY